jgi:hypothetical protein
MAGDGMAQPNVAPLPVPLYSTQSVIRNPVPSVAPEFQTATSPEYLQTPSLTTQISSVLDAESVAPLLPCAWMATHAEMASAARTKLFFM